jgi:hypothetical protein
MAKSRRAVLKSVTLAGTALFLPVTALEAFQQAPRARAGSLRPRPSLGPGITRSVLREHVGSDFVALTDGAKVTLRLVEVEDVPNAAAAKTEGSEDTFAARFEDSSGVLLSQGTYTLLHDTLGKRQWFLVPVGRPKADKQTYEAIFAAAPAGAGAPPQRLRPSI